MSFPSLSPKIFSMILAIVFSIVLLNFSGCSSDESDSSLVDLDTLEYVSYTGEIQSLGNVKFDDRATHLLRLKEGGVVYVYSEAYDLSDPSYKDQSVEVNGFLFASEDVSGKSVLRVDDLKVVEIADETSEQIKMLTYVSSSLQFSMDYRSNWSVSETASTVLFESPESTADTIQISTESNPENLPLEEWYKVYSSQGQSNLTYSVNAIGVKQIPAIKVALDNVTTFYIDDDTIIFEMSHRSNATEYAVEYSKLFSTMLYSFDRLSDGQRDSRDDQTPDAESSDSTSSIESYEGTMATLSKELNTLVPNSGDWSPILYEFVDETNYIYVQYQNLDGSIKERILVESSEDKTFTTLAHFEVGSVTDWTLASGSDVAKGFSRTLVYPESETTHSLPEGYRALESPTYDFWMPYPSQWYYTRSGNEFYFSAEPATVDNALVTLRVEEGSVASRAESAAAGTMLIQLPRSETEHYVLSGPSIESSALTTMADGLVSISGE